MPLSVSVLVSTYNGAAFVCEAFESVFAQALLPQEIVILDDASADNKVGDVKDIARSGSIGGHTQSAFKHLAKLVV